MWNRRDGSRLGYGTYSPCRCYGNYTYCGTYGYRRQPGANALCTPSCGGCVRMVSMPLAWQVWLAGWCFAVRQRRRGRATADAAACSILLTACVLTCCGAFLPLLVWKSKKYVVASIFSNISSGGRQGTAKNYFDVTRCLLATKVPPDFVAAKKILSVWKKVVILQPISKETRGVLAQ